MENAAQDEEPEHITGGAMSMEVYDEKTPALQSPLQPQQQHDINDKAHITTAMTTTATATTTSTNNRSVSNNNVPRHMRLRYWNSYEELHLVELWRLYASEIVSLQQHTPIFRTIADGMKQCGFQVNPQECRRKINSLKNKYILEKEKLQRLARTNHTAISPSLSEWRLYPLIECVLEPKQKIPDLQHELRIVNKVLAQLAPSTCTPVVNTNNNTSPIPTVKTITPPPTTATTNPYKRVYNPRPINRSIPPLQSQASIRNVVPNEKGLNFLLKLKHNFALPTLEELRVSNKYLEECRDYAKARLKIEEAEYKLWQTQLNQWQLQQEQVLKRIQCGGEQS